MVHGGPQPQAAAKPCWSTSSPMFPCAVPHCGARGAREGDGDPYHGRHEAAEGLGRRGLDEGRRWRSELDEKVLKAQR
jgi:hypothetical protein